MGNEIKLGVSNDSTKLATDEEKIKEESTIPGERQRLAGGETL